MKPFRLCAIIVLIILGLGIFTRLSPGKNQQPATPTGIEFKNIQQIFPQVENFRRAKAETPIYEVLGPNQALLGYAFYTPDIVTGINGHGGPIDMAVGIDRSGTILGIDLVNHQETPAYVQKLPEFLKSLTGKSTREPLEFGKNIDGISGATITSRAVIDTLNAAAASIHSKLPPQQKLQPDLTKPIAGLFLFILAIVAWLKPNAILRWTALSAGFIVLKIIFKEVASVSHIAGLVLGQVPEFHQNMLLYILLTGAIVSNLLLGRVFCAGVCPFAFVQEGLYKIKTLILPAPISPNAAADNACRWIKYIILIAVLSTCIALKQAGIGAVEVYVTLVSGKGTAIAWALAITVLIASLFFLRFWCRYLCPFGAFLALFAQFAFFKKRYASSALKTLCMDSAECFSCDRCRLSDLAKSTPVQNSVFIFFIVITVALFSMTFAKAINDARITEPLPQETTAQISAEKPLVPAPQETYHNSVRIKRKLEAAGITPHPAKYWSAQNDE